MAGVLIDAQALAAWIGREQSAEDLVCARTATLLAATLDRAQPAFCDGDPLPPLWHWALFVPDAPARELDSDGHAKRGGFLPPVPLPRRMFAGARLEFHRPLEIGARAVRRSRIEDVSVKQGRSGTLAFVKLRHDIECAGVLALTEMQDIVYREATPPSASAPAAQPAPAGAHWADEIRPDPVLLFRYSALTFNGHRIHYDRPYAMNDEGYPGLVVHGPLIATLLAEALARRTPGRALRTYAFRAVSPLFDTAPFRVCGRVEGARAELWAMSPGGTLAMSADATLS